MHLVSLPTTLFQEGFDALPIRFGSVAVVFFGAWGMAHPGIANAETVITSPENNQAFTSDGTIFPQGTTNQGPLRVKVTLTFPPPNEQYSYDYGWHDANISAGQWEVEPENGFSVWAVGQGGIWRVIVEAKIGGVWVEVARHSGPLVDE